MNQAVRMVLNLDSRVSMNDSLRNLNWPNLDNLWHLEQITALSRDSDKIHQQEIHDPG